MTVIKKYTVLFYIVQIYCSSLHTTYIKMFDCKQCLKVNISAFFSGVRKWVILEPSIFLFLMSARMVYFTRQNLYLDVVCMQMKTLNCASMSQVDQDNFVQWNLKINLVRHGSSTSGSSKYDINCSANWTLWSFSSLHYIR